jgi:hypothetical protein
VTFKVETLKNNEVMQIQPDGKVILHDVSKESDISIYQSIFGDDYQKVPLTDEMAMVFKDENTTMPYNKFGQQIWVRVFSWTTKIHGDIVLAGLGLNRDTNLGLDSDTISKLEWWVYQADTLYLQDVLSLDKIGQGA